MGIGDWQAWEFPHLPQGQGCYHRNKMTHYKSGPYRADPWLSNYEVSQGNGWMLEENRGCIN